VTFVCLALVGLLAITITAFTGLLRSRERAHARREDLILNQLLHAVGRPWTPAPAEAEKPMEEPRSWTWTPEQLPVDQPEYSESFA
jgi:hypothetical protein